jgi:hypothetical protein
MADFSEPLRQAPIIGQVLPRQNYDIGAVITAAAQGAGTLTSGELRNPVGRGIRVVLDITSKSGTIDVVVNIYSKDKASGKRNLLLASASKTATGTTILTVHPDLTGSANSIAKDLVGDAFEIDAVNGTGSSPSATYTVGVCLLA